MQLLVPGSHVHVYTPGFPGLTTGDVPCENWIMSPGLTGIEHPVHLFHDWDLVAYLT